MLQKFLALNFLFWPALLMAQDLSLSDLNGDGAVSVLCIGDSLTRGIGDGASKGGYPGRLSALLGVPFINSGIPGEELTEDGSRRIPNVLLSTNADSVLILEGANDAVRQIDTDTYRADLQKMVNVAYALDRSAVLMTLPEPTGEHESIAPITAAYSSIVRETAALNGTSFVDLERAWKTTCQNKTACELYNLPEGLHPTAVGYDVMAQTVAATLLGIDIFQDGGAADLEGALGLPEGSVLVKPDLP